VDAADHQMAALIAGMGDATGLALARTFARKGLAVYGARRRPPSTTDEFKPHAVCVPRIPTRTACARIAELRSC
jgi:NAD(P)-dependent dehydrogenase (short-subunit alcohol dehydrogenase family)